MAFDNTPPTPRASAVIDPSVFSSTALAVSTIATTNIATPTTAVANGATIGGYTLSYPEYVLLIGQTTPAENGLYRTNVASGTKQTDPTQRVAKVTLGTHGGTYWTIKSLGPMVVVPFAEAPVPHDDTAPTGKTPALSTAFDNTAPTAKTPALS